jgi:hypothetical protein
MLIARGRAGVRAYMYLFNLYQRCTSIDASQTLGGKRAKRDDC